MSDRAECRRFEKAIPSLLDGTADFQTLKQLRKHYEQCPDCREELSIQFLVTEGMNRLEEGSTFDLQGELQKRLFETDKKIRFHSAFLRGGMVMELLFMAAVAGFVAWIVLG